MDKRIICNGEIKKSSIKIIFLLLLMHDFFYLVPQRVAFIRFSDILFILPMFMILLSWGRRKNAFLDSEYRLIFLSVPALIIMSAFAAAINYGQGIIQGIMTQRLWFSTSLLFFVFHELIKDNAVTYEEFQSILFGIVTVELIIYFTQFFLGSSYMFLSANHNMRYGTLRLYCNPNYMLLVTIWSTERFLKKKDKIRSAVYLVLCVTYIMIVNKGRGATMMFLGAIVLTIMLGNTKLRYKALGVLIFGIISMRYLFSSTVVQEFIGAVFNGNADGTLRVREYSQAYYLKIWGSSLISRIFGFGYANSNNMNSVVATGSSLGYNYADNGIYGFLSSYGSIGIVWWGYYNFTRLKKGIQLRKESVVILVSVIVSLVFYATDVNYFYTYYSFDLVLSIFLIELMENNKTTCVSFEGEE